MRKTPKKKNERKPKGEAAGVGGPREDEAPLSAELVDKLLKKVEDTLASGDFKPSVGDLVRLLELRKKLETESVREVEVKWVAEPEGDDVCRK